MTRAHFGPLAVLLVALLPNPPAAQALEGTLCADVRLLDRAAAQARALASDGASTPIWRRYRRDLARLATRLGASGDAGAPSPAAAALREAHGQHLRFRRALETGGAPAAAAVVGSAGWRRVDAQVGALWRAHACIGRRAVGGGSLAAADPGADAPPAGDAAPPPAAPADDAPGGPAQARLSALPGAAPVLALGLGGLAALAVLLLRRHRRRSGPQAVCFVGGALQGDRYCEGAEIVELSRGGCKIQLHGGLSPTQPLTIFVGDMSIPARAVWNNAHYAGVRFDQALSPAHFRAILDQPKLARPEGAPPVPALPCHSATCRETCARYLAFQQDKAGPAHGAGDGQGAGAGDRASRGDTRIEGQRAHRHRPPPLRPMG